MTHKLYISKYLKAQNSDVIVQKIQAHTPKSQG